MSRNKRRQQINQQNAQYSTGPRTPHGIQRSRMNAFKHNLSGNHLILQEHEYEAYKEQTEKMLRDLKPETEPERQIAQKVIDINFRLNRMTSIENNMLNWDMLAHTQDSTQGDREEVMLAQTRAWKQDAKVFDLMGRYEARLSKQLLQYQHELERMKLVRWAEEAAAREAEEKAAKENSSEPAQPKVINPDLGSFGNELPQYIMSAPEGVPATACAAQNPVISNADIPQAA